MVAFAQNKLSPACAADAGNRRVRKMITNGGLSGNIPNGTTDYLWSGWQTAEERNPFGGSGSTDTPTKQYIWGQYIDECVQLNLLAVAGPQSLPIGNYYLLQDLLYRAMALTSSIGAVVEAYDEDAYGNTLIFTAPGPDGVWFTDDDLQSSYGANEIIYCGYRFDPEAQLYYVRNRYYSPVLGRWISQDPLQFIDGANRYQYVEGAPAGNVDPTGFSGVKTVVDRLFLFGFNNATIYTTVKYDLKAMTAHVTHVRVTGISVTGQVGGIDFGAGFRADATAYVEMDKDHCPCPKKRPTVYVDIHVYKVVVLVTYLFYRERKFVAEGPCR